MSEYAGDFTLNELLAVTAAKEIKDHEVLIAGIGIPTLACALAKNTHAGHIVVTAEWGSINPNPRRLMFGVTCSAVNERATAFESAQFILNDMQRGRFDLGVIGGAQIDKYGNVNSTWISEKDDKNKIKIMLAGSGGANDIAVSAGRTMLLMRSTKKSFVEHVDYITSPGYVDGPGARERYGMPGGGPSIVISAEGTFRFDDETKEMYLATYHPGMSVETIKAMVPWNIKVSPNVTETEKPTPAQLKILRTLDPLDIYLGDGKKTLGIGDKGNFDLFLKLMNDSFDSMSEFVKNY